MKEMKILLVDDEERFLITTQKLLIKRGFDVQTASGGAEALEKLSLSDFHVVILDVKMPGMDGIATLREIRKRFPLVEVIMLTGHATLEMAVDGLKAGAMNFLIKPADIDELVAKAEEAYTKRNLIEERIRAAKVAKVEIEV